MRQIILNLILILFCTSAHAVEVLIKANPHWMDEWKASKVNSLSTGERQSYEARAQLGDIIVIRPDGWVWGGEECLPRFIVVKLPGVTMEAAKLWEESLYDRTDPEHPIMLKVRKYAVPQPYVNQIVGAGTSVVTINLSAEKTAFLNSIVEKTQ